MIPFSRFEFLCNFFLRKLCLKVINFGDFEVLAKSWATWIESQAFWNTQNYLVGIEHKKIVLKHLDGRSNDDDTTQLGIRGAVLSLFIEILFQTA